MFDVLLKSFKNVQNYCYIVANVTIINVKFSTFQKLHFLFKQTRLFNKNDDVNFE